MTFRHSGELGDVIYMLPVLRALGGRHTIRLVDRVKEPPFSRSILAVANILIPLLKEQKYILDVECSEDECDVDMSRFRAYHQQVITLTDAQVQYFNSVTRLGIRENGSEPWLTVGKSRKPSGKIIVARSTRYNNPEFPWQAIVEHYGNRLVFVGLPHEHKAFEKKHGKVRHEKVNDLLGMAILINNSELFIGNQSSPMAIAIGLGIRSIQETFIHQPDCIFPRENIQYCHSGKCILPDIGGSGELKINFDRDEQYDLSFHREFPPPGSWQYPGAEPSPDYGHLVNLVCQLEKCSKQEADRKIAIHNIKRCPQFFRKGENGITSIVHRAMMSAGVPIH